MHKANIPFVRYADDFLLFTPSQASGERALAVARKALKRLDLELNPEKTQVVEASPGIRFLGERLPGPPTEIKTPQRDKTRHDKRPSRG
ncbi:MAG: reverse transcriptase domain-containing protein [Gammaproteobacteria bacterium]